MRFTLFTMLIVLLTMTGCGELDGAESQFETTQSALQDSPDLNADPNWDHTIQQLAAELRQTDLIPPKWRRYATRKMKKALTGPLAEYCDPDTQARLMRLPTVPTGVTNVNFDYSGDLDERSVGVSCRYDMYGTIGPQQHYHCCFFGETNYDFDDGYFHDSRIGIYGKVQMAPNFVFSADVSADVFDGDDYRATIGIRFSH